MFEISCSEITRQTLDSDCKQEWLILMRLDGWKRDKKIYQGWHNTCYQNRKCAVCTFNYSTLTPMYM
jgi:hypothetical protein